MCACVWVSCVSKRFDIPVHMFMFQYVHYDALAFWLYFSLSLFLFLSFPVSLTLSFFRSLRPPLSPTHTYVHAVSPCSCHFKLYRFSFLFLSRAHTHKYMFTLFLSLSFSLSFLRSISRRLSALSWWARTSSNRQLECEARARFCYLGKLFIVYFLVDFMRFWQSIFFSRNHKSKYTTT